MRKFIRLTSYALLFLALTASPASAAPQPETMTDSAKFEVSSGFFDCQGSYVSTTGKVHLLTHTTVNDNRVSTTAHTNLAFSGTNGVGTEYVFKQVIHETVVSSMTPDNEQRKETFVFSANGVSKGGADNMRMKILMHTTFNSRGEITAVVIESKADCQG
jgi:hypothetical protein